LAHNGSYIVHPDKEKLQNPTIFSQMESNVSPSELDAAESMLAGEHGMKEFRRGNRDWCVFYKPFQRVEWEGRSNEKLGWSVGVVYPEEDIFGNHKILLYMVLCIAVLTILVFFMLSSWILRRQLKPLKKLAFTARRIAEGNYTELLPKTDRLDEIGLLQNRFNKMQRSLQIQVSELEEEEAHLQQQSQSLAAAYTKTVDTDVMKTSFLHYMMNQIDAPSESIDNSVTTLCNNYHELSQQEIAHQVENIQRKGEAVVELLNHLAHVASIETGKEASHV
jgi:methyl-accepting chemotaxis protein